MNHVRWREWAAVLSLALGLVLASSTAWAQATGSVTGRVTDRASGRPLEGAEVGVAGTNIRVSTDREGRFTIPRVPAGAQTLRALMIGYTRLEASVNLVPGQAQNVDFTLAAAAMQLDEVVVTGQPGRTEKRTLGNAVSKIDAANVAEAGVVADVQDLLTGRTPGLTVIANSGQAGAGSNFRIRGAGSMEAGYQPVYYIDGIRFESRLQNGFGTGNSTVQPTNPLSFLNPDDIESVEVIKGPSAATLYGADAAGGVIQIITKKGRRGAGVQWTFGAETGQSEWTRSIGNPVNYWLCRPNQIGAAGSALAASYPGCAGMDPASPETSRFLTHDPLREDFMLDGRPVIRKGDLYKVDISARGGGDFFNYYMSFDRYSEDGVFWNNFDRRMGGRANIEFTPSEKYDIGVTFGYIRNHGAQPLQDNASNGLLRNALRGQAKGPVQSNVGKPGWRGFAPDLSNSFDNQIRAERTTIGLTGNWRPFSFMQNRITLGLDKQDLRNTQFYAIDTLAQWNPAVAPNFFAPWGATNATGVIDHFMPQTHVWTADIASTVNFDISPVLTSAFSGGMQLNSRSRRTFEATGEGLIANTLNLVGGAAVQRGDEDFTKQTSLGFYVQEQVGWRERMYGTVALRVDDNSAFGSDFSLVYYPKASLAWVVSEEEFFPLSFVEQMKLRLAWGKAGQAPQPFSADRTFTTNTTTGQVGTTESTVSQLTPSEYGNPNLKAEEGVEYEAGFDASFLNGKLGLEFTY
ncbi:MAG TPA: TonB-dependent receptor, partial [Gemmatimonadales bacterium]|nr:TonB-dependent receptor [Gemmatimonadales bacterium]